MLLSITAGLDLSVYAETINDSDNEVVYLNIGNLLNVDEITKDESVLGKWFIESDGGSYNLHTQSLYVFIPEYSMTYDFSSSLSYNTTASESAEYFNSYIRVDIYEESMDTDALKSVALKNGCDEDGYYRDNTAECACEFEAGKVYIFDVYSLIITENGNLTQNEIAPVLTSRLDMTFDNLTVFYLTQITNQLNDGLMTEDEFYQCMETEYYPIGDRVYGTYPFSSSQSYYFRENVTDIIIPSKNNNGSEISKIEIGEFCGFTQLKNVSIPYSVTSIGAGAFDGCSLLESIELSDSVSQIGNQAFYECGSLAEIIINNPDCDIYDDESTIPEQAVIHGYSGSTAQAYAEKYNRQFVALDGGEIDPPHTHSYVISEVVEGTCVTSGYIIYRCECGDTYREETTSPGHRRELIKGKEPTCTETGLTDGYYCPICETILEPQEVIPVKDHQYKSETILPTANSQSYIKHTCVICGDTYNSDYFYTKVFSDITSATAGSTIRVPVSIKNNTGILGWKLTFDYDTDVLTPISVDYGEVISGGIQDNIEGDMAPGSINVYWAGSDNEDYNGVMFYINFEVNPSAVGNTKIDITYSPEDTFDTDFNDVYLDCQPINLSITNNAYSQYAKINASADDITAGDDLQLKLNISEINSVTKTNVIVDYNADNFEFKSVNSANGITVKDTDNNGKLALDISDITDTVNDTDFVTVTFKCKDKAMSGNYDFAVSSADEGIICKGCSVKVKPSATSEIAEIYADDVAAKYNDEITIPIYIDNNHGIMGYRLDFQYDTSLLEPLSTSCGTDFSNGGQFNDSIGVKDGEFKVLWNNVDEKFANGILLNLKFKVLTDEKVDTVISMAYSQPDTFNEKYEDVVFNCKDINVSLNNHQHSYTAVVTEPACTEKGYTTYTCSCGDSYVADETAALGHSYGEYVSNNDATYDSDGTKTAVCSRCGEKDTVVDEGSKLVRDPDLTNFIIKTVSLSLESSITMNFKVLKNAVADYENIYVKFDCEGDTLVVNQYTELGDYYVFDYSGISPQLMSDNVHAVLYATYKNNGKEYHSPEKIMSVKEYAYTILDRYNTSSYSKLRTLLVDLLNYGAATQVYKNYKVNELVNAELTEEQQSWGTHTESSFVNIRDYNYNTITNPKSNWTGSGLVLNNSVMIRCKFTADNLENKKIVIKCNGGVFEYTEKDLYSTQDEIIASGKSGIVDNGDGSYYVFCNELYANEMSKEILLTVYENDKPCSNTMRFSIESYAKLVHDAYPGDKLDNLTQAMMRYGKSAEAYSA